MFNFSLTYVETANSVSGGSFMRSKMSLTKKRCFSSMTSVKMVMRQSAMIELIVLDFRAGSLVLVFFQWSACTFRKVVQQVGMGRGALTFLRILVFCPVEFQSFHSRRKPSHWFQVPQCAFCRLLDDEVTSFLSLPVCDLNAQLGKRISPLLHLPLLPL